MTTALLILISSLIIAVLGIWAWNKGWRLVSVILTALSYSVSFADWISDKLNRIITIEFILTINLIVLIALALCVLYPKKKIKTN